MRVGRPVGWVGRLAPRRIKHHLILCREIRHDPEISLGVSDGHGGEIISGGTAEIAPIRVEIGPGLHLIIWTATTPKQRALISRHTKAGDCKVVRARPRGAETVQTDGQYNQKSDFAHAGSSPDAAGTLQKNRDQPLPKTGTAAPLMARETSEARNAITSATAA